MNIRTGLLRRRESRPGLVTDFLVVLGSRNFRRLLATRLLSQFGDGIFTAAIGTYVFFSRSSFPNPAVAATAFAVLYLPYSLIGPFAGVFIDRWSRRQILVWSAVLRAGFVVLTASLVASGSLGFPLYVSVLAALGVNRFFLSSLSAALPHVVDEDELVMANAVAPTVGTIFTSAGALAELGVHLLTGGGRSGSAIALLVAGGFYLLAGTVGATMHRDLLGPPRLPPGAERAGLATELGIVVRGLVSGAVHAWQRRPVAAALGATAAQRVMFGALTLSSILLYRNYFYTTSAATTSLAHFVLVVVALAAGLGGAAVITPAATRRMSKEAWITILLAAGGLVTAVLGPTFIQPAFLAIALILGLVAQSVAICATTILQQRMDDSYRGRVFSIYDMLFNVPYVLGAVAVAQVIPVNGKSYLVIAGVAAGYLVAAAAYGLVSRQALLAGPDLAAGQAPGGSPSGGPPGPEPPGGSCPGSGAGSPSPDGEPAVPGWPPDSAHRSSS